MNACLIQPQPPHSSGGLKAFRKASAVGLSRPRQLLDLWTNVFPLMGFHPAMPLDLDWACRPWGLEPALNNLPPLMEHHPIMGHLRFTTPGDWGPRQPAECLRASPMEWPPGHRRPSHHKHNSNK